MNIEQARKTLRNTAKDLSDEEIRSLLDVIGSIAQVAVDEYFESKSERVYNENGTT